jgi:hypothetical protein
MKFSAPKQITWIVALILGVVGILAAKVSNFPLITPDIGFWLVVAGWLLLLIATITRGL